MAHRPVEVFLARLDKVRRSSHGWSAKCPAHEDRLPSLAIAESPESHVLLNCFAGCLTHEICAAIGLRECDLFEREAFPALPPQTIRKLDREEISRQVWFAAVFVADYRAGKFISDDDAAIYAKCIASLIKALPRLLDANADHLASQTVTVLLQYLDEKKARLRGL